MNTNIANVNTGLASRNDEFQWFKPNSSVHVEGVVTSEPDFSIPPTPASSYANLHVVLDHIHPSTETHTTGMVPSSFVYQKGFVPSSQTSVSINQPMESSFIPTTSTPIPSAPEFESVPLDSFENENFLQNKIDVVSTLERAIPVAIDPEQPMARSNEALTSLKSEVAPMPVDPLAERMDRQLPEAVELGLFDETYDKESQWAKRFNPVSNQIRNRNWKLKGIRGPKRGAQWKVLSSDIRNKKWNLNKTPSRDAKYRTQWTNVGSELLSKKYNLRHIQPKQSSVSRPWAWVDQLENQERRWRMSRGIDALWSGRTHNVGKELMSSVLPIGWSQWFTNLKNKVIGAENKIVEKSIDLMDSASDVVADISEALTPVPVEIKHSIWQPQTWHFGTEHYDLSLPRHVPSWVRSMEETERLDRQSRGINPVLSGQWYRIGRELKYNIGEDVLAWLSGLKNQLSRKSTNLISSAKESIASINTTKAPLSASIPKGLSYEYDNVDFTFKSGRVPRDIIEMEESERSRRMQRGVCPIILGRWYQIGLELKHKFSLRPTFTSTAAQVIDVASSIAEKASDILGDLSEKVIETGRDIIAQATPVSEVDLIEKDHPLNLFAYIAEPIDFTFKSRRCPAWIIAAEEEERNRRVAQGVDVLAYQKWNALLSSPHKTLSEPIVNSFIASAKEALVESSKGFSGFFSSIAHTVADRTSHLVDVASHNQYVEAAKGYYAPSATKSVETTEKVDPMTAARLGRVQDELLKTVKSI